MTTWIAYGAAACGAYLLGSIPFGLIVSRARGIDIRQHGSRNIGATNVFRVVGKPWGILTFAADFLKGLLPVVLAPIAVSRFEWPADPEGLQLAAAVAAIAGHNWPVYLRFHGGKGVATTTGALLALSWPAILVGAAAWLLVFAVSRYVSLASMAAAAAAAVAAWCLGRDSGPLVPGTLTVLALLIIVRHKANILRLIQGTEHRFERGKGPTPPGGAPPPP